MIKFERTKIVATLGPATASLQTQEKLILAGMNVARLNFAHSQNNVHAEHIRNIRTLSLRLRRPIGILQDLPGPKIRVSGVTGKELLLNPSDEVQISHKLNPHAKKAISISYPNLAKDLKKGHTVFIADGTIRLAVEKIKGPYVWCRVLTGGIVRVRNGVNLPMSKLSLRAFTKEDEKHLRFGISHGIDFVGVSFIEKAADVERVRAFSKKCGRVPFIIAKIERQQALKNLKSIIRAADGIMVARGDLGVEIPFSDIPGVQQEIVTQAHMMGKPVIVATQVLESMVHSPRPTRAEATDVDNAIQGGADAIMLSGETSVGKYPLEAVSALKEVIASSEGRIVKTRWDEQIPLKKSSDIFSLEACHIAEKLKANLIVIPSKTGITSERVSKFRPPMPIVALLTTEELRRKFSIYWGVKALPIKNVVKYSNMVAHVRTSLLKNRWAKKGDRILVVSGAPGIKPGRTGMVQLVDI